MQNHRAHDEACAAVAARFSPRWLPAYAASKLRSDPIFAAAYDLLGTSTEPLLDIGCGIGLLPLYLRERGLRNPITGIDIDDRKVQRAPKVAGIEFLALDASSHLPEVFGDVALIDVLHYLEPEAQSQLLREAAARLSANGILLLRDGIADRTIRFRLTLLAERFAQALSWNIGKPLHFPTRESITAAFPRDEFMLDERPMYGRTPFNNWLFIIRRRGVAPDAEQRSDSRARPGAAALTRDNAG
jgi:SAM-dependent methyltransferase